jgi:hypothetical protein
MARPEGVLKEAPSAPELDNKRKATAPRAQHSVDTLARRGAEWCMKYLLIEV